MEKTLNIVLVFFTQGPPFERERDGRRDRALGMVLVGAHSEGLGLGFLHPLKIVPLFILLCPM